MNARNLSSVPKSEFTKSLDLAKYEIFATLDQVHDTIRADFVSILRGNHVEDNGDYYFQSEIAHNGENCCIYASVLNVRNLQVGAANEHVILRAGKGSITYLAILPKYLAENLGLHSLLAEAAGYPVDPQGRSLVSPEIIDHLVIKSAKVQIIDPPLKLTVEESSFLDRALGASLNLSLS